MVFGVFIHEFIILELRIIKRSLRLSFLIQDGRVILLDGNARNINLIGAVISQQSLRKGISLHYPQIPYTGISRSAFWRFPPSQKKADKRRCQDEKGISNDCNDCIGSSKCPRCKNMTSASSKWIPSHHCQAGQDLIFQSELEDKINVEHYRGRSFGIK